MFLSDVLAVTYGGDSVSIVNPFAITGDDNSITSLACAKNGFAFADAATTCSFYSIFPVAGPITLNGGRLWLNSDLILTNTGSFTNLGTIKGQNHVLSLSPYMTTFNYQDNPSGVTALSLVERQTLPQTLNSVDWSSDGNYVAVVSDLAGGGTPELRVYSFNGTSLSLVASTNISVSSCFSVRWRPTTGSPSTYHLALTASFGDRLRLYSFTPPSTLSEVAITAEVPTSDTYNAVSWQGRGNYLVLGGPATYLYYFNGTTFSAATSFDNDGTVSRNAIQWAPTGNKDDFIVGTDSGHLYLFNALDATPTMSLQRDYNFGGQINALDWAPTSTYIALGFQDGSIKTYQHAAEFSTIIQRNSHPYSQAVDAVSWKNDASRLVVGYVSGAADEFSLLSFDDEDYSLDQIYAADVGQTINALRYSPDGDYIARLDNSSNFLSIYRPIFSQFIFDNVNLFLNGNLTLSSALTFQGACTVNGQGNKMTFTGDGTISVAQGSNVEFKLMDLSFDRPNAFALQGPTSTVSLRNSKILLNSDVVVGGGAMNFYDDVVISGSHTINYQSEFTSTIHRLSTLTLEKDAMLQIGKVPSAIRDPLEFESSSAVLNFDNATLHITSSGLRLTKGAINIYNQSIFDIDSTASQDGLILGNGTSGNDVLLKLHGSAARLDLVGGALTLDGYSPDVLEFTGQPQFAFDSTSSLYAKRPLALDGGWLIPSSGATLYVDPSAYVTTSRTRLEYPDSLEDFVLSGTLESFDEIVLDNGGRIDISSGALAKNVQVNAFDNIVSGNGRFNGSFDFVDRRSTLSWDVIALLDNGDVDLHGGQLILTQPSGFVENYTFVGTGTVNTGIYTFDLGTLESTWTGSIYWDGQRAPINFNNDVNLTGMWTFSGDCFIDGRNNTLDLLRTGSMVIERGSTLTLKNVTIKNINRNRNVFCMDDAGALILNNVTLGLTGDATFEKGLFECKNTNNLASGGGLDTTYTFSYLSGQTSIIHEHSSLNINDRIRFSCGRAQGDSNVQPLSFEDTRSFINLIGGTLHITSSGATFTNGQLFSSREAVIEVDCPKYDYALILGDGVDRDKDFRLSVGGDSTLTLSTGKIFYNNYESAERFRFINPSATLQVLARDALTAKRDLLVRDGIFRFPTGRDNIGQEDGATFKQDNITHIHNSPFSVHRLKADAILPYELNDAGYFYTLEGSFGIPVLVQSGSAKFGGSGLTSSAITLRNSGITLHASLLPSHANNITLNGGTLYLDSDFAFIGDKTLTGSGIVNLNHRKFSFGSDDLTLTHTILWQTASAINLNAKTSLTGTWTFEGVCNLNGHGNILDLSSGGNLAIYPNSTLNLTNVVIKGLGATNEFVDARGSIDFLADSSELRLSNAYIELTNNITTTVGGIYIDGPSTVGFKNHTWTLEQDATMTIAGTTLWQDPLGSINYGRFAFGSGAMSKYLTLVSTGTIKTAANLDTITSSTTYLNGLMRQNSNTIAYIDAEKTITVYTSPVSYTNDATVNDAVLFKNGLSVAADKTVTLNTSLPVSGAIDLHDSGAIILSHDLELASDVLFASGCNIDGNGNMIILANDLTIPDGKSLHVTGDLIIDGQGNSLIVGQGARLILDPSVTLTLKNINWFNTLTVPVIEMRDATSQLVLQDANLCFDRDFAFTQGRLFIHQAVAITGSSQFVYASTNPMTIQPFSTLYVDLGATFSYSPDLSRPHTDRNLMRLYDETSTIYLNGCSFNAPDAGLQLTKGRLIFDNKVTFNGNNQEIDAAHSFEWGDGISADNDMHIQVLAGARVTFNGFVYHNPA